MNENNSINVIRQTVEDVLKSGKDNKFVIPDYQRPYAWTEDEIRTLFEDIVEFVENNYENKSYYFLGSMVSYINENGEREIIDGQQRITSLFLLLRAIYTKLEASNTKTQEIDYLSKKIEPTIWKTDELNGAVEKENILIESQVINNEGNGILKNILEKGKADAKASDNYSKNYIIFQQLYDGLCKDNALLVYKFINAILTRCIMLPISTDSRDTALTIFSTLNNRGLPLSDADIFKAKIYNNLKTKEERKNFIDEWKELDENAKAAGESIQSLFYYYMFYLRAQADDKKTTTPGIRKFFLDKTERLFDKEILKKLNKILNIWYVIKRKEEIEEEPWSKDINIRKVLDILTSYPNEFWKYPVVIYYMVNSNKENFAEEFLLFLKKLASKLILKYIEIPSINEVKGDILKLNVECIKNQKPTFTFKEVNKDIIDDKIINPSTKVIRMLLKVLSYSDDKQKDLLPANWEIEHVFPRKWHKNYSEVINQDETYIRKTIEKIGNKIPLEKKSNIEAGNKYFESKKKYYSESKIAMAQDFSKRQSDNWTLEDINKRSFDVCNTIKNELISWDDVYTQAISETDLSEEEKELLNRLESSGTIKIIKK